MAKTFQLVPNMYFHKEEAINGIYNVFKNNAVIVKDKEDIKHFEQSPLFEELKKKEKPEGFKETKYKSNKGKKKKE